MPVATVALLALVVPVAVFAGAGAVAAQPVPKDAPTVAAESGLSLYERSVVGVYQAVPSAASAELPVIAMNLHVELPAEAAELGLTDVMYSIRGQPSHRIANGTVPASADGRSIDIPLDPSTLAGPGSFPFLDAEGRPWLAFSIHAKVIGDSPVTPPPGLRGTEGESKSFQLNGSLRLVEPAEGASADSAVLDLAASRADSYTSTKSYWADPADPVWLRPGGVTALAAPLPGPDSQATSYLLRGQDVMPLTVAGQTAAPDGSVVVSTAIPADLDTTQALSTTGTAALGVTLTSGTNVVDVSAAATIERPLENGAGISRVSGANRYDGAAAVARALATSKVDSVYLASGHKFADALSIAPLAALEGRPVLLGTTEDDYSFGYAREAVTSATSDVGARKVVQIGGESSLPAIWRWYLQDAGNGPHYATDAISGVDRYEVSRNVAAYGYGASGASTVFIATGRSFADALSAVPAAASQHAPVILVDGEAHSIDAPTRNLLSLLGARTAVIVGGTATVSPAIEAQLKTLLPGGSVTRFGGEDRYAVSQSLNSTYFPHAGSVFLATGETFADALTGAVLAGGRGAPLYLVHPGCVPGSVLDSLSAASAEHITLLGGPVTLDDGVVNLQRCP